ncbi:MAG TPA: LD-carboxypeptidase [Candidatus Aenigmarchaeota archaeon]|nr:LD-carboxypeptidase [Candidatus Aenigmarchaeota archaeon]
MKLIVPPKLKKGDTIAFVSPSAGLAGLFKYRVKRAIRWFREEGFKVKLSENFWETGYIAGSPEGRARDLNEMILDEEVKAIISAIGGEHSIQILRYVNFEAFKENPKIFSGFSDITVLHLAFYKISGVQTYYGPMVLTQFGEYPKPSEYTIRYFYKAVMHGKIGKIEVVDYTDQFLDWKKYKRTPRRKFKKNKLLWLREGKAKGRLIGGCMPSILRVTGTSYFPSFHNSIIFLETPEGERAGKPYKLEKVDADLSQLREVGIFEKARGLILGIPYRYTKQMKQEFYRLVLERLKDYDFPILANVNFGHTDPIITIPYGAQAIIDSEAKELRIEI